MWYSKTLSQLDQAKLIQISVDFLTAIIIYVNISKIKYIKGSASRVPFFQRGSLDRAM